MVGCSTGRGTHTSRCCFLRGHGSWVATRDGYSHCFTEPNSFTCVDETEQLTDAEPYAEPYAEPDGEPVGEAHNDADSEPDESACRSTSAQAHLLDIVVCGRPPAHSVETLC